MAKHGTSARTIKSRVYYLANVERIKERVTRYRADNAEKIRASKRQYSADNKEAISLKNKQINANLTTEQRARKNAMSRLHYLKNKERIRELHRQYYKGCAAQVADRARQRHQENPGLRREKLARQRAAQKQATPKWLTRAQIKEMRATYQLANADEHVDHMVPIAGEFVCGLHVPWNLAILPAQENRRKQNKWPYEMAIAA